MCGQCVGLDRALSSRMAVRGCRLRSQTSWHAIHCIIMPAMRGLRMWKAPRPLTPGSEPCVRGAIAAQLEMPCWPHATCHHKHRTHHMAVQHPGAAARCWIHAHQPWLLRCTAGGQQYVSHALMYRMGQYDVMGAYPLHWHGVGEGEGQYARGAVVWRSFSRCVTIHCTDNVQVRAWHCCWRDVQEAVGAEGAAGAAAPL